MGANGCFIFVGDDPFAIPSPKNKNGQQVPHRVELSFTSLDGPSSSDSSIEMDPGNLSIGHSEVSLSGLEMELGIRPEGDKKPKSRFMDLSSDTAPIPRPSTPESESDYASLETTQDSPSSAEGVLPPLSIPEPHAYSPQATSPLRCEADLGGSGSLGSSGSGGSVNGRTPRISREEVHKRLLKKRSVDSPAFGMDNQLESIDEKEDGKRMSVVTDYDMSTETAVVERRNVVEMRVDVPRTLDLDLPHVEGEGLKFDFSQFGMSARAPGEVDVDMRSALDRLMDDVAGAGEEAKGMGMRVEAVTEGVKAGRFDVDDSLRTETDADDSRDSDQALGRRMDVGVDVGMGRPPILPRAATDPDIFSASTSRSVSGSTIPPPPPPKDARKSRDELIIEKRREARRKEEDESLGYYTPPRPSDRVLSQQNRRRSRSTGDMEELARKGAGGMLDVGGVGIGEKKRGEEDDLGLGDSIQRELRKLGGGRSVSFLSSPSHVWSGFAALIKQQTYHIKEQVTIYASSDAQPVSHMVSAGDVHAGKSWRPVRRPSDMVSFVCCTSCFMWLIGR